MVKGKYAYIPKEFVEELEFTKRNYNVSNQSDAFRRMLEDIHIGRELRVALRRR